MGLVLAGGTAACASDGSRRHSFDNAPIGASLVTVQLQVFGRGLEDFRANLEKAMGKRYYNAGEVAFRRIQFIIEKVDPDPKSARDLVLRGRLVVVSPQGTEQRAIERRILGGAKLRPSKWEDKLIATLLPAIDYQLRLLQT